MPAMPSAPATSAVRGMGRTADAGPAAGGVDVSGTAGPGRGNHGSTDRDTAAGTGPQAGSSNSCCWGSWEVDGTTRRVGPLGPRRNSCDRENQCIGDPFRRRSARESRTAATDGSRGVTGRQASPPPTGSGSPAEERRQEACSRGVGAVGVDQFGVRPALHDPAARRRRAPRRPAPRWTAGGRSSASSARR